MKRYVDLETVRYECQTCGVHFDVYYPEKPKTDPEDKPYGAKCPCVDCDGTAKPVEWSWDEE